MKKLKGDETKKEMKELKENEIETETNQIKINESKRDTYRLAKEMFCFTLFPGLKRYIVACNMTLNFLLTVV